MLAGAQARFLNGAESERRSTEQASTNTNIQLYSALYDSKALELQVRIARTLPELAARPQRITGEVARLTTAV